MLGGIFGVLWSILKGGNNVSENLAPKGKAKSPTALPHLPSKKVHLWHIFFASLAMNGSLPAELKFREKTGSGYVDNGICSDFSFKYIY